MYDVNDAKTAMIAFRAARDVADRIEQVSEYHGRPRSEELRLAWAVHDLRSVLASLDTAEALERLGPDAIEATRGTCRERLAELERRAYRVPQMIAM